MNIEEAKKILETEKILGRTPKGRVLREYAIDSIDAVLDDVKNYHMDVVQCLGCGFVISELLTSEGCPNCGVESLTKSIKD